MQPIHAEEVAVGRCGRPPLGRQLGVRPISPAGSKHARAPESLKIGFIYSGPIGDVGWTHQHDLGRKLIEKEFGSKIETVFVESVPESADAECVIRI